LLKIYNQRANHRKIVEQSKHRQTQLMG